MSKVSHPTSIAPILKGLTQQFGLEKGLLLFRLQERWKEAVGPQIASHTHPSEIRFGALVLLVDSAAWIHELSFLKKELVEKSNALLGRRSIERLTFKMGALPPSILKPPPDRIDATEDSSPAERIFLEKLLAPIADPGLREAIRKAMRRRFLVAKEPRG